MALSSAIPKYPPPFFHFFREQFLRVLGRQIRVLQHPTQAKTCPNPFPDLIQAGQTLILPFYKAKPTLIQPDPTLILAFCKAKPRLIQPDPILIRITFQKALSKMEELDRTRSFTIILIKEPGA